MLDVFVIGLAEGSGLDGVVDGEDGVALMDLGVVNDGHHGFNAAIRNIENLSHVIFHVIARDKVRGHGSCGGTDGRNWGVPVR